MRQYRIAVKNWNLANVNNRMGNLEKARVHLDIASKAMKDIDTILPYNYNQTGNALVNFYIGNLQTSLKNYDSALVFYKRAIDISDALNTYLKSNAMAQIGIPFNALKLYDSTIGYCSRSLELSERFNAEYKPVALEQLAEAYYAKGDFQKAFEFYKRFKITNDSVNNFDRRIATFINEKAEKEKQEIELRKNEVELRQNFTLLIGGIIALFLIAIAFITQNRYRVTRLLNAKLNESNATKDKLFAIISHDLKGPLSAFTELSNTLFRYGAMLSEEERSTTLTNMRRSSGNILRLLDNLLSWSRVQMKGYKIYPEPITLKYLVEEVLESLADLSAVKKMKLSSKIDEEIEIVADRNGLEMVVRNLVSNAIKYSEIGGEIAIVAKTVNGKTEISVRDEGVGVSEEMQKILFSSAPVKSKTGTKNEKGTGLGLVICKEIVELHGGEIRYEPNAGKGSVFTISM